MQVSYYGFYMKQIEDLQRELVKIFKLTVLPVKDWSCPFVKLEKGGKEVPAKMVMFYGVAVNDKRIAKFMKKHPEIEIYVGSL